jgi:hypothetical protein
MVHAYKVHAQKVRAHKMHAHKMNACKMHRHKISACKMYDKVHACKVHAVRCMTARHTPVGCTSIKCTPIRFVPHTLYRRSLGRSPYRHTSLIAEITCPRNYLPKLPALKHPGCALVGGNWLGGLKRRQNPGFGCHFSLKLALGCNVDQNFFY